MNSENTKKPRVEWKSLELTNIRKKQKKNPNNVCPNQGETG